MFFRYALDRLPVVYVEQASNVRGNFTHKDRICFEVEPYNVKLFEPFKTPYWRAYVVIDHVTLFVELQVSTH